MTVETGRRTARVGIAVRARWALSEALQRVRPDAALDAKGYVVRLEDNLLPGIARADIEAAFGAGAGQELEGKMRAPWSSSAFAVNSFAPWQRDPASLMLAGITGFTLVPRPGYAGGRASSVTVVCSARRRPHVPVP